MVSHLSSVIICDESVSCSKPSATACATNSMNVILNLGQNNLNYLQVFFTLDTAWNYFYLFGINMIDCT